MKKLLCLSILFSVAIPTISHATSGACSYPACDPAAIETQCTTALAGEYGARGLAGGSDAAHLAGQCAAQAAACTASVAQYNACVSIQNTELQIEQQQANQTQQQSNNEWCASHWSLPNGSSYYDSQIGQCRQSCNSGYVFTGWQLEGGTCTRHATWQECSSQYGFNSYVSDPSAGTCACNQGYSMQTASDGSTQCLAIPPQSTTPLVQPAPPETTETSSSSGALLLHTIGVVPPAATPFPAKKPRSNISIESGRNGKLQSPPIHTTHISTTLAHSSTLSATSSQPEKPTIWEGVARLLLKLNPFSWF